MYRRLNPTTAAGRREITGRPLDEIPDPPSWMTDAARRKFIEVATYLVDLRAITAGEVSLVEQFSAVYARWAEAEAALAAGDPGWRVVVSRGGAQGSSVPTAMMLQSMRSVEQLRKLAAMLGLAPVERARLPVAGGDEGDEVDRLFEEAGLGR